MIRRLYRWLHDRHDPAAVMQAPVQKFTGHDASKAEAIFAREQRQAARRRQKAAAAIAERKVKDNVTPLRKTGTR